MASDLKFIISGQSALDELKTRFNLTDLQVKQIGSAAINRSLTTVSSRVIKRIADVINLRQKDIRDSITIRKASYDELVGTIEINRVPIPMFDFIGTRETSKGVSVQVLRNGPRELLTTTFFATMDSGHIGVFERERIGNIVSGLGILAYRIGLTHRYRVTTRTNGGGRVPRLPIFERFGPTITAVLTNGPEILAEEQAAAGEILQKNMMSQLQRRLAQNSPAE
jgi:hypothetical protein